MKNYRTIDPIILNIEPINQKQGSKGIWFG